MDNGLLQRGWNGDLHHGCRHLSAVETDFFLFPITFQLPHQQSERDYCGNSLGDQCRQRNPADSLTENDHQDHVQRNV